METALPRPLKAGLPPWLFFALVIIIIQIPKTIELIRGEIADDEAIAEQYHVQLAIARLEDPALRFPIKLEKFPYDKEWKAWLEKEQQKSKQQMEAFDAWLKKGASTPPPSLKTSEFQHQKELDAWIKKQQLEEEQRKSNIREWLLEGAAARFRRDGSAVLTEIGQTRHMDEETKGPVRNLVQMKRNQIAIYFEELEEHDLRAAIRQENGLDPTTTDKAGLIAYLLEVDEAKRSSMSRDWPSISGAKLLNFSQLGSAAEENSVDAWRAKFHLIMLIPGILLELGILVMPLVALADVLLPNRRKRFVERKYDPLVQNSGENPEINEMAEFIERHMPSLDIRTNLLKPGSPFVYPEGYRRPCLAILNDLYKIWRRDREKAEKIILHELEHVRQGDYLLLGYGSIFPKYLRVITKGVILVTLFIVIINLIFLALVGFEWKHHAQSLGMLAGMVIGMPLTLIFLAMSRIIAPLFGIWASEFNADYGASQGKPTPLNLDMASRKNRVGLHWWLGGLTHPPQWLRAWLAAKDTWLRDTVRHLIFPTAYFLVLLMLIFLGLSMQLPTTGFELETVFWLLGNARDAFSRQYWVFGGMAALLLAWPFLAPHWERFFSGNSRAYVRWDVGRSLAAFVLAALAGMGYWMGPFA